MLKKELLLMGGVQPFEQAATAPARRAYVPEISEFLREFFCIDIFYRSGLE
jgi:hypothetical protein